MYDIITLGSATVDMFGFSDIAYKKIKLGDKVILNHLEKHTGGGGTNSAATFGLMGIKTAYMGKIGNDFHGRFVKEELKKLGVDVLCSEDRERTAFSMILCYGDSKDRIIYAYKGASDSFCRNDFSSEIKCKWYYMGSLMGKGQKAANYIAVHAGKNKIKLLFNPSQYMAIQGKKALRPILRNTTLLVLNKKEAQTLLGIKSQSFKKLCNMLSRLGPEMVIITDGARGVFGYDRQNYYHVPAAKVNVINTTGAGDAFASGMLSGIIKGNSFSKSMAFGVVNAANCITRFGAKKGMKGYKQTLAGIKQLGICVKKVYTQKR